MKHRQWMMRSPVGIALLLLLSILFLGCGGGGSPTGSVEGYVFVPAARALGSRQVCGTLPPSGYRALAGLLVQVSGTNRSSLTDNCGHFLITAVPVGARTLTISGEGYSTSSASVTVSAGATTTAPETRMARVSRKWTMMVYLNASNDLEPYGSLNVKQMEQIGSTAEVDIVAQWSRINGYDTSGGDWTETRRYRILKSTNPDTVTSPVLEHLGQLNMGTASTLQDFLQWAMANYPADHYLLVIWDHGAGWRKRSLASRPLTRGVSWDDRFGQNAYIKTWELPSALQTTPKLDLVAFDASLMQMVEVAYELRDSCQIMVGSEESPPGEGYPYQTWLGDLAANPLMTPAQLASKIVHDTIDNMGARYELTQSSLDMAQVGNLATALDQLAQVLRSKASLFASQLAAARDSAQYYGYNDPFYNTYKDLYDYVRLIKANVSDSSVQAAATAVQQALAQVVFDEAHTGSALAGSHGLSIWVPSPTWDRSAYTELAFGRATQWGDWLSEQRQ